MSLMQASKISFPYTFNQLFETAKSHLLCMENNLQQRAAAGRGAVASVQRMKILKIDEVERHSCQYMQGPTMQRLVSLLVFCVFLGCIKADVAFTWPYPGATLGSGDVTLWWREDGNALLIEEMGSHLLVLFTGSNNVMQILNEWVIPVGTYNATIHLNSNIGPNANNSYFFGIQSNPINTTNYPSTSIPVLTNFSPRFSLTNMTGKDFSPSMSAANAACNTTDGPDSVIRDESQDQISLGMANITSSGVIHNPTDGVLVTTVPLTPVVSATTSPSSLVTTILFAPTPTASPQPVTETPTQTPISIANAHKRMVIAVPIAIGVAALAGLFIFFVVQYRRRHPSSEKADPDGSILPFFPSPPTHPNTWMDTKTSTFKNKSNRFWYRLKAKRPRNSVAELPGYESPGTLKSISQRNTSPSGTTITNRSEMAHTPIIIPSTAATVILSAKNQHQAQGYPGREVGFLAVGPNSAINNHNSDPKTPISVTHTNHSYSRASTIKTITTESSGVPSSSALSSSFDRERKRGPFTLDFGTRVFKERETQIPPQPPSPTALRGTAKVVTIPRSNSLLHSTSDCGTISQPSSTYYPARKSSLQRGGSEGYNFSTPASIYQKSSYNTPSSSYQAPQTSFPPPPTSMLSQASQLKRFRSPMVSTDESAAVREAEIRIRGLLGNNGGIGSGRDGIVSPISPVSPLSR
ncbi:putative beta glucan boisynthesis protein [Botrytis fragariae]|uniref:Putative beta glucan boisynthesis protein n=1 Tax=Botrytis fragariae TaxID=1964551 RepID=A0A8H6ANE9_9HELO|nr:putative beta glucan boisynthesis protein [Botrytis fragariae]KAF5870559.1 putative beta glucan boisynthesis protein [Botrytis fragariae]